MPIWIIIERAEVNSPNVLNYEVNHRIIGYTQDFREANVINTKFGNKPDSVFRCVEVELLTAGEKARIERAG